MSDEESYHYSDEDGDDSEEYGFDYSDAEASDDESDEAKNAYYGAKDGRDRLVEGDDGTTAADVEAAFRRVWELEARLDPPSTGGVWSFRAHKQLVKMRLKMQLAGPAGGEAVAAVAEYDALLHFCGRCDGGGGEADAALHGVKPNMVEKAVTKALDLGASCLPPDPHGALGGMYAATLAACRDKAGGMGGDRLWFRTRLRLGQLCYEAGDDVGLRAAVADLLAARGEEVPGGPAADRGGGASSGATAKESGSLLCPGAATDAPPAQRAWEEHPEAGGRPNPVPTRAVGTNLLEIYALMIQLYSRDGDNGRLRDLYVRSQRVEGGIPHPRTLAVIKECGGKMHMREREFEEAAMAFFDAFRSYDEAGDAGRLRCLKYQVLASMLSESGISPFDSPEARPFRDHEEIVAMTDLVAASRDGDVAKFEKILRRSGDRIMGDTFIRGYIDDLLRTVRSQVVLRAIGPYTRVSLSFLSKELNGVEEDDVEGLLASLILDGRLEGRIDQVEMVLYRGPPPVTVADKNRFAVEELTAAIGKMTSQLITVVDSSISTGGGDKGGRIQRWGD